MKGTPIARENVRAEESALRLFTPFHGHITASSGHIMSERRETPKSKSADIILERRQRRMLAKNIAGLRSKPRSEASSWPHAARSTNGLRLPGPAGSSLAKYAAPIGDVPSSRPGGRRQEHMRARLDGSCDWSRTR